MKATILQFAFFTVLFAGSKKMLPVIILTSMGFKTGAMAALQRIGTNCNCLFYRNKISACLQKSNKTWW
ncbi:hypothetical protein [Ferruginibacter sp.]|uniref:hypothetical protein n=1 Tax=Ferruginibacter sp. TaxID=1940288 RepID=UPI00265A84CC|nr:hypothetical protein [Ferruginibacter sp.]